MANSRWKVHEELCEYIRRNWQTKSDIDIVREYDGAGLDNAKGFDANVHKVKMVRLRMGLRRAVPESRNRVLEELIRDERKLWAANAKIEARALEKIRKAGYAV